MDSAQPGQSRSGPRRPASSKGFTAAKKTSKKGKKGKKGKQGKQGKKGKKGKKGGDSKATPEEVVTEESQGGIAEKVERKNRKPQDTLTFHSSADEETPEATEEAEESPATGEEP